MKQPKRHYTYFVFAGGFAFLTNATILYALEALYNMSPYIAQIPAAFAGLMVSWFINRTFTFPVAMPPSLQEFFKYLVTMLVSSFVNYLTYILCITTVDFLYKHPAVALIPATFVSMFITYFGSRVFVFKGVKNEREI